MNRLLYLPLAIAMITVADVAGSARAAESVSQLIKQGEAVVAAAHQAKAAQNDISQRNTKLKAESTQLKSDQATLQSAVTTFQDKQDKVKGMMADYQKNCAGKTLPEDKYKTCKDQEATILAAASSVNAAQVPLVKQQDEFNARVTAFQSEVKRLKTDAPNAAANYEIALNSEQDWLNQARGFLMTPAVRHLARKAHCENFQAAPKGINGLNRMSDAALACLKKIKAGG